MLPTRTLFEFWGQLWGTTSPLQEPEGITPKIRLIVEDFTPSLDLTLASLELAADADFQREPFITASEDVQHGVDPVNGDKRIDLGGSQDNLHFTFDSNVSAIGKTAYGTALLGNGDVLLGTHKFAQPIAITRTKQLIDLVDHGFRLPTSMVR